MTTILHISCDFPDPLAQHKTQAIKRLVDGLGEYHHIVYSLNRVDGLHGIEFLEFEPDRIAVAYRAPPKGLFLKARMEAVADSLLADVRSRRLSVDLVHAHKLTIDGLAGARVARDLGTPIVFSIQGYTDLKVISARPDLTHCFAAHVDAARALFPFAPWTESAIAKRFPEARGKMQLLPVVPALDVLSPAPDCGTPFLVSVFHLEGWANKNVAGMAAALNRLAARYPGIRLDVIGGGSPRAFLQARDAVRRAGAGHRVAFLGPVANDQLPRLFKKYAAFALPTRRESYGLAHIEALFAGLPILLSRDTGIDGLLPQASFAVACDPFATDSIANGIQTLLDSEVVAKASLADAQRRGDLDHLRRQSIFATYRKVLAQILGDKARPPSANSLTGAGLGRTLTTA